MHSIALILVLLVLKIVGEISVEESSEEANSMRITGGFNISIERAPYYVQIIKIFSFKCGGSILSQTVVLTAGHCAKYLASYFVIAGSDRMLKGTRIAVKEIIKHPNYKPDDVMTSHDIALFFLKKKLTYSTQIQPIVIPNTNTQLVETNSQLFVVGLGRLKNDTFAQRLQGVAVPMIDLESCYDFLRTMTNDSNKLSSQFCVGDLKLAGKGSCKGDSGGPVTYYGMQYGVVSHGFGCGTKGKPKILANLVKLNGWIRQQVKGLSVRIA